MLLIAGLGNFESKYLKTRHNAGFLVLGQIAQNFKIITEYDKFHSHCADIKIRRHKVTLIKPLTFMNLSGEAVKSAVNSLELKDYINELIVIHDDVDIEFGKIKVKNSGSDAGHNGIKNIIENINTESFIRIRIGVGRPEKSYNTANFVLDNFSEDEYNLLTSELSKKIISFLSQFLELGYSKAKSLCQL